jgi:hypothetical protein
MVRLAAHLPFAPAAALLHAFTGVVVAPSTVRRQAEAAGARYVAAQTAEVAAIEQTLPPAPPAPPQLVLEVDGAMVPLRGGEWAEVRTLAIGTQPPVHPGRPPPATQEVSYFSRLSDAARFERLSLVEVHRRGVEVAAAVAAVADGAEWIQSLWAYHCPQAVRILDFAHVVEHLGVIAGSVWGEGSRAAAAWVAVEARILKQHGPAWLLDEVRGLALAAPDNEHVQRELAYLEKRAAHLDYPAFRAAGWPLGSGVIESANKVVVEARLKGAGMRWGREQVNPLLGLRTVVCNDRWAEGWAIMERGATAERRARQATRAAARLPAQRRIESATAAQAAAEPGAPSIAVPPPALAAAPRPARYARAGSTPTDGREPWRPAANHPWKRRLRAAA